ncbi:MAG: photosynthetic reaction center cytochrome c subunit [Acidobacteria bacterium]|nr:photosynthetic reaction center cytochrome c subunit [Acidobacteriota bacterium]
MHGTSQRALFGFLVLALVACLAGTASLNAQAPAQAPGYKNVLILKDLPADLMQPTMQMMEISLGVHCVYCHDADNTKRELDTKPEKITARRMIQMVADINRTQFAGREVVNCFTCHQGSTKPTTLLPYNGEEGHPGPAQAAGPMPTVDQLLDRYTTALGGADALAKVPGRTLKGTVINYAHLDQVHTERAPTVVTPVDIVVKGPDKRMVVQHNINADAVATYNGAGSWARAGAAAPTGLRADLVEVAKLENAVMMPSQFKQLLTGLKVEGEEKVGERTAWVVSGASQWLPGVKLYFDRDTSYLLSVSYQQKSGYCCHVFRIDYDNFLVKNGIRMPMQWTVNGPREAILVYKFDSAEIAPIDDARFARPAAATAAR